MPHPATAVTGDSRASLQASLPSYSDKDTRTLRIAASDVAAVAGYNTWTDVRELFLDRLLYQVQILDTDRGALISRQMAATM